MGVPVPLRIDFNRTAGVYTHGIFAEVPSLMIEEETFLDIFEPIGRILKEDELFMAEPDIPDMIDEMRTMCLEAHATSTRGSFAREDRNKLINTLQSIKEKAEEGVDENGMRAADMSFFSLHNLIHEIREAAMIHGEYLNNAHVAEALDKVADNIQSSNNHLWRPQKLPKFAIADDYKDPASLDVA